MKKIFLLSVIALALGACSNENPVVTETNGKIALQVSGNVQAVNASPSRVAGSSWETSDSIGVFMLDGTTLKATNRKYINASGSNFSPADAAQTIYFPIEEDAPKMDFIAWYPYQSAQSGLTFSIDLSDQDNQYALDLMTADKIIGKDKNNSSVAFNFKHRLTKLQLKIQPGIGLDETGLTGMAICITGQHTAAECNLETGHITVSPSTADIDLVTQGDGLSAQAILMPAGASQGRQLIFTLSSQESFAYTIPSDRIFNAGEKHNYAITLNRTEIGVEAKISDWTEIPGSGTAD